MFEMIRAEFIQDQEKRQSEKEVFIRCGYYPTWNNHEKENADQERGLRHYLTAAAWESFKAGKITREKAIEKATRRAQRETDKSTAAGLAKLDAAEVAPDLDYINIDVEWVRSSTWGYNPRVDVCADIRTYGRAGGCGYDKESAAVAEAFNDNPAILKILYQIKENGLRAGESDADPVACSGRDNRNICGYGSGYSVIPYFEGGVGVSCFWSILKKAGFECVGNHGKREDLYTLRKN